MNSYWFYFEGIAGSGKTTQCELLKKELAIQYPNLSVHCVNEFSDDIIGRYINRKIEKGSFRIKCFDDLSRNLMMIADRLGTIHKLINDCKANIILFDRFIMSDLAHALTDSNGSNDKEHRDILLSSIRRIYNIDNTISNKNITSACFYLSTSIEIAYSRIRERNSLVQNNNQFNFLQKLDKNYRYLLTKDKNVNIINADKSVNEVKSAIVYEIKKIVK